MAPWDPAQWSPFAQAMYGVGALYLVLFFAFFALFHRAAARARSGEPADVQRYNRLLRGFPNAFYAKLLGKRRLETQGPGERGGQP